MTRFKYAAAAIALLPAAALAQEPSIVVTATGAEQNATETGQAITVIDRAMLEARQTVVVSDLLATTLGVTVSRNGGIGQPTAVRIRGAEGDQTLVLVDGVRVVDPSATGSGYDFGNLLAGNIERIEVLRGPNSVPWGSQAIGGIINVITARPAEGFSAAANAEYGYKDAKKLVGRVNGGFGPVRATVGGGYFDDEGISAYKLGTERDGFRQYTANGRVEIDLSDAIMVDLRGNYADSRAGFDGFPPPLFSFADTTGYSTTKQAFGYAGIKATLFGGAFKNRLGFTLSDTRRASYSTAGATPSTFKGRIERYEYQGDATIAPWLRAVFGVEHEDSRFTDTAASTYKTGVTSGFAQFIVKPLEALTLTGGARVDDHRAYGTKTTFGANAAWQVGSGTIIRASYGEGFKAPSLYQLYGPYSKPIQAGTTVLQPETAQSYDLGIEQSLLDGAFKVGVTAFHRDTTNQIDFFSCFTAAGLCAVRPFGYYDNIARTRTQGIETFIKLRPAKTIAFDANYTLIDAKNRVSGDDLPRRPRNSINANIEWTPRDWVRLGASVRTVSHSRDSDYLTFSPTSLDGYTLVGLRAAFNVGQMFEIYGGVDNLTDARYEEVSGYGTLGRNARVGVRVKL